jgi:hypothetical protein
MKKTLLLLVVASLCGACDDRGGHPYVIDQYPYTHYDREIQLLLEWMETGCINQFCFEAEGWLIRDDDEEDKESLRRLREIYRGKTKRPKCTRAVHLRGTGRYHCTGLVPKGPWRKEDFEHEREFEWIFAPNLGRIELSFRDRGRVDTESPPASP